MMHTVKDVKNGKVSYEQWMDEVQKEAELQAIEWCAKTGIERRLVSTYIAKFHDPRVINMTSWEWGEKSPLLALSFKKNGQKYRWMNPKAPAGFMAETFLSDCVDYDDTHSSANSPYSSSSPMSRRSDGSTSPSTAIISGRPTPSETPSARYQTRTGILSTPLSVRFGEDSTMIPSSKSKIENDRPRTQKAGLRGRKGIQKTQSVRIFISHASEDKSSVARRLALALVKRGHKVWFDEFVLELGDSLKRSIDKGLAECDFGIVILSKAFFSKRWPQEELGGLVAREMANGEKLILPIWHDINADGVRAFSPTLADRVGIPWSKGIRSTVQSILKAIESKSRRLIPFTQVRLYVVAESRWVAPRLSSDCRV